MRLYIKKKREREREERNIEYSFLAKRIMKRCFFLDYSDEFDSSHFLFLLMLIINVFCLNTRARFLLRE